MEVCFENSSTGQVDGVAYVIIKATVSMPAGYDGVTLRMYNQVVTANMEDDIYTPEIIEAQESVFFHMD